MFPKIGVPPNHPILIGFSFINHPFSGVPPFLETSIHKLWFATGMLELRELIPYFLILKQHAYLPSMGRKVYVPTCGGCFLMVRKKGECSSPMDGMGAFSNIEKKSSWWFQNSWTKTMSQNDNLPQIGVIFLRGVWRNNKSRYLAPSNIPTLLKGAGDKPPGTHRPNPCHQSLAS